MIQQQITDIEGLILYVGKAIPHGTEAMTRNVLKSRKSFEDLANSSMKKITMRMVIYILILKLVNIKWQLN